MLKVQRFLGATLLVLMSASGASAIPHPCWDYGTSLYEAGSGAWLGCIAQGAIDSYICLDPSRSVLMPINDGACHICVDSDFTDEVVNGRWDAFSGHPGLKCLGCISWKPFLDNFFAWWALDERSGRVAPNWTSYDEGTLYGNPVPVPGKVNYGLKLDGVDDYVEVPDPDNVLNFSGNFTISAWIKVAPADLSGVRPIVEKRQQSPLRGYSFYIYRNPAYHPNGFQLGLQLADGSGGAGYANYGSTVTFNNLDGGWHLVAVSINRSSRATFYVDGAQLGQPVPVTATPLSIANSSVLRIGMTTANSASRFKGVIDEVMMFDRTLSASEVLRFFTAGSYGMCRG